MISVKRSRFSRSHDDNYRPSYSSRCRQPTPTYTIIARTPLPIVPASDPVSYFLKTFDPPTPRSKRQKYLTYEAYLKEKATRQAKAVLEAKAALEAQEAQSVAEAWATLDALIGLEAQNAIEVQAHTENQAIVLDKNKKPVPSPIPNKQKNLPDIPINTSQITKSKFSNVIASEKKPPAYRLEQDTSNPAQRWNSCPLTHQKTSLPGFENDDDLYSFPIISSTNTSTPENTFSWTTKVNETFPISCSDTTITSQTHAERGTHPAEAGRTQFARRKDNSPKKGFSSYSDSQHRGRKVDNSTYYGNTSTAITQHANQSTGVDVCMWSTQHVLTPKSQIVPRGEQNQNAHEPKGVVATRSVPQAMSKSLHRTRRTSLNRTSQDPVRTEQNRIVAIRSDLIDTQPVFASISAKGPTSQNAPQYAVVEVGAGPRQSTFIQTFSQTARDETQNVTRHSTMSGPSPQETCAGPLAAHRRSSLTRPPPHNTTCTWRYEGKHTAANCTRPVISSTQLRQNISTQSSPEALTLHIPGPRRATITQPFTRTSSFEIASRPRRITINHSSQHQGWDEPNSPAIWSIVGPIALPEPPAASVKVPTGPRGTSSSQVSPDASLKGANRSRQTTRIPRRSHSCTGRDRINLGDETDTGTLINHPHTPTDITTGLNGSRQSSPALCIPHTRVLNCYARDDGSLSKWNLTKMDTQGRQRPLQVPPLSGSSIDPTFPTTKKTAFVEGREVVPLPMSTVPKGPQDKFEIILPGDSDYSDVRGSGTAGRRLQDMIYGAECSAQTVPVAPVSSTSSISSQAHFLMRRKVREPRPPFSRRRVPKKKKRLVDHEQARVGWGHRAGAEAGRAIEGHGAAQERKEAKMQKRVKLPTENEKRTEAQQLKEGELRMAPGQEREAEQEREAKEGKKATSMGDQRQAVRERKPKVLIWNEQGAVEQDNHAQEDSGRQQKKPEAQSQQGQHNSQARIFTGRNHPGRCKCEPCAPKSVKAVSQKPKPHETSTGGKSNRKRAHSDDDTKAAGEHSGGNRDHPKIRKATEKSSNRKQDARATGASLKTTEDNSNDLALVIVPAKPIQIYISDDEWDDLFGSQLTVAKHKRRKMKKNPKKQNTVADRKESTWKPYYVEDDFLPQLPDSAETTNVTLPSNDTIANDIKETHSKGIVVNTSIEWHTCTQPLSDQRASSSSVAKNTKEEPFAKYTMNENGEMQTRTQCLNTVNLSSLGSSTTEQTKDPAFKTAEALTRDGHTGAVTHLDTKVPSTHSASNFNQKEITTRKAISVGQRKRFRGVEGANLTSSAPAKNEKIRGTQLKPTVELQGEADVCVQTLTGERAGCPPYVPTSSGESMQLPFLLDKQFHSSLLVSRKTTKTTETKCSNETKVEREIHCKPLADEESISLEPVISLSPLAQIYTPLKPPVIGRKKEKIIKTINTAIDGEAAQSARFQSPGEEDATFTEPSPKEEAKSVKFRRNKAIMDGSIRPDPLSTTDISSSSKPQWVARNRQAEEYKERRYATHRRQSHIRHHRDSTPVTLSAEDYVLPGYIEQTKVNAALERFHHGLEKRAKRALEEDATGREEKKARLDGGKHMHPDRAKNWDQFKDLEQLRIEGGSDREMAEGTPERLLKVTTEKLETQGSDHLYRHGIAKYEEHSQSQLPKVTDHQYQEVIAQRPCKAAGRKFPRQPPQEPEKQIRVPAFQLAIEARDASEWDRLERIRIQNGQENYHAWWREWRDLIWDE